MSELDIAILTILPEEYQAVCSLIPTLQPDNGTATSPNLYAWRTGKVANVTGKMSYTLAVGMIGRAGTTKSALATLDAIERWHPRYLFFVGIAGGFSGINKGDVVLADTIYGYEYGKIEKPFNMRHNWTFNTDQGLLNSAVAYGIQDTWKSIIVVQPPQLSTPVFVVGEVASGDKVVDDPSNDFFVQVQKALPKIKAVEMEGAGAGEAIDQAQAKGYTIGFMMLRGISDLPRPLDVQQNSQGNHGTQERDNWKPYASATVGSFLVGWLQSGLPVPPKYSSSEITAASLVTNAKINEIDPVVEKYGVNITTWKDAFVDALLNCQSMKDFDIRAEICNRLPPSIQNNISHNGNRRVAVVNIVSTCMNYPDGIDNLVNSLYYYERDTDQMGLVFKLYRLFVKKFKGV